MGKMENVAGVRMLPVTNWALAIGYWQHFLGPFDDGIVDAALLRVVVAADKENGRIAVKPGTGVVLLPDLVNRLARRAAVP